VQLVILAALSGLGLFVSRTPIGPPPPAPAALATPDLDRARHVLEQDRTLLERELRSALLEQDESKVTDFVALQVQAADLEFKSAEWTTLPQQGAVVPVELTLRLSGSYYNLPILVDGLFRQARPVHLRWLEVESPKALLAHTNATLRMRFQRPPSLQTSSLTQQVEALDWGGDPATAEAAMTVAAELALLEAFRKEQRVFERVRTANRSAVTTALPGLLRRLPSSPLGWVGMRVDGETVEILQEPGQ
jgi:hypothetical protein